MPIPEQTRALLVKLRYTANMLDAVAVQARSDKAYKFANDAANTILLAMHRIEDLAGIVEDMAPTFQREPDDDATEQHARDLNNQ